MFGFLRRRRRRRLLAEPFPAWQETVLRRNMPLYDRLSESERATLQDRIRLIVGEMKWEGCNSLHVTDEIKLVIAAWAGLLILGLEESSYDRVSSVVVYPSVFATPNPDDDWEDDELSDTAMEGQAVYRGPVILSWDTILAESRNRNSESNLVLHEFAHQLDFLDGEIDGTPALASRELAKRWGPIMQAAYDRHLAELRSGRETFFTEHAGDGEGEFFADAVETFFCLPHELEAEEPEVHAILAAYFRLQPKAWFPERDGRKGQP